MALALKDQFQITIVPAYAAADGKRFHDATEAQAYTRNKMLDSVITAAAKENPAFARLDHDLLRDFLLRTGRTVGAIMAEPLTPHDPTDRYRAGTITVTNTPRAGESPEQSAARVRVPDADAALVDRLRAAAGVNARPAVNVEMPAVKNPDIFQNRTLQAARAVDEADLDAEVHDALTRSVG